MLHPPQGYALTALLLSLVACDTGPKNDKLSLKDGGRKRLYTLMLPGSGFCAPAS